MSCNVRHGLLQISQKHHCSSGNCRATFRDKQTGCMLFASHAPPHPIRMPGNKKGCIFTHPLYLKSDIITNCIRLRTAGRLRFRPLVEEGMARPQAQKPLKRRPARAEPEQAVQKEQAELPAAQHLGLYAQLSTRVSD